MYGSAHSRARRLSRSSAARPCTFSLVYLTQDEELQRNEREDLQSDQNRSIERHRERQMRRKRQLQQLKAEELPEEVAEKEVSALAFPAPPPPLPPATMSACVPALASPRVPCCPGGGAAQEGEGGHGA